MLFNSPACDFSGYSDIARGVSRLFGVEPKRNFELLDLGAARRGGASRGTSSTRSTWTWRARACSRAISSATPTAP